MRKRFLLFLTCCFITASWALVQPLAQLAEPHIIIINPGFSDASFDEWGDLIGNAAIYKWGRSHNLYMRLDAQPVVDNIAGYISPEGALSITVGGLKRGSYYTMWIDFVTFNNPESVSFSSLLKVFIKNDYYLYREIAAFSLEDMPSEPVKIPIPFELSEAGKIYILFEGYDSGKTFRSKAMWGMWDIIIADVDDLKSAAIPRPEGRKMQYKIDILR